MSIVLKGDIQVEFFRVEENGDLKSIDRITVNEYLGEQILNINSDRLEIAFELWHDNPDEDLSGERKLMIVSAKELKMRENQDEVWNKIFGKTYIRSKSSRFGNFIISLFSDCEL